MSDGQNQAHEQQQEGRVEELIRRTANEIILMSSIHHNEKQSTTSDFRGFLKHVIRDTLKEYDELKRHA